MANLGACSSAAVSTVGVADTVDVNKGWLTVRVGCLIAQEDRAAVAVAAPCRHGWTQRPKLPAPRFLETAYAWSVLGRSGEGESLGAADCLLVFSS